MTRSRAYRRFKTLPQNGAERLAKKAKVAKVSDYTASEYDILMDEYRKNVAYTTKIKWCKRLNKRVYGRHFFDRVDYPPRKLRPEGALEEKKFVEAQIREGLA